MAAAVGLAELFVEGAFVAPVAVNSLAEVVTAKWPAAPFDGEPALPSRLANFERAVEVEQSAAPLPAWLALEVPIRFATAVAEIARSVHAGSEAEPAYCPKMPGAEPAYCPKMSGAEPAYCPMMSGAEPACCPMMSGAEPAC